MNTFVTDGMRLAYRIDGPDDAPALVLINSLGTNLHMWDPQIARLSQSLRVIRYDSRGQGTSTVPTEHYSLAQLGQDVLALLDTLGIERAHLCGLSLGGITALEVAIHHPERVRRAVFANTAAHIGTEESWNTRIDAVKAGGMQAIRDGVLARFLSERFRQNNPETARWLSDMVEATDPQGYIETCLALRDADLREQVATISVPSLIIASELDESTPPSQAHELHKAIAGSELVVFPSIAHISNIERPEEFGERILNFLSAP